jgi:hypothetical protein
MIYMEWQDHGKWAMMKCHCEVLLCRNIVYQALRVNQDTSGIMGRRQYYWRTWAYISATNR